MLIKLRNEKGNDVSIVSFTNQMIVLPLEVHTELVEYTKHYRTEVSGAGLVEKEESRTETGTQYRREITHTVVYTVTEVFLPPKQSNGYCSTEIEESAISEIVTRLIKEGRDPSKLRLHWHSHVSMDTFHSGVDEENYNDLDNKEYLVSLVTNKGGDVLGRVDIYSPTTVAFINVPVFVSLPKLDTVEEKVRVNIEALDKYVKEENARRCANRGFGVDRDKQVAVGNKFELDAWRREQKIRKKVRKFLNISDEKALKFELCKRAGSGCDQCQDVMACISYLDEAEARLMGKGGHVENREQQYDI